MAQLNVLVALTRDGGRSWASRALRTPLAQWLGKLSMNIYLLHYPLLFWLAFALHGGRVNRYSCGPDESPDVCYARFEANKGIAGWGVAAVAAATLLLAELCYRVVEAPARKCLRREG
jgi:peptidoglycan/LPS O-acetylase OafA/YrhL